MQLAAFENEPDAAATATMLREQGYQSEVTVKDGEGYDERMHALLAGRPISSEPHALLTSDADRELFAHAVTRHYGKVVQPQGE